MPELATVERTCERCGGAFLARPSKVRAGKAKTCSRVCAGTAKKPPEERTCPCGETFTASPSSPKRFHSKSCAARHRPPPSTRPRPITSRRTRPAYCEQTQTREPQTWVPSAELAPLVAEAIAERGIKPVAQQLTSFDSQLEGDSAERWLRRLLAGQCGSLVASTRADSLMLALGLNLNQSPLVTVLPAGTTAAEMMLAIHADLRGEVLEVADRIRQAVSFARFAQGFIAGLEDRLPHEKTTEKEAEEVAA